MAQAGVHAIVGIMARKWMPKAEWLLLGVVLGNMFPDLDNLAVAYATLTGADTHGLHRTFTHSILTVIILFILFYVIAAVTRNPRWNNFGLGFGMGILMHILLDLLVWFNGVEILWPIRYELNIWSWFEMPAWLRMILDTTEFLAFSLYFLVLNSLARWQNTDLRRRASIKAWMYFELTLFVIFTAIFFTLGSEGLQYTIFGALYILSLIVTNIMTIQMKDTVETLS